MFNYSSLIAGHITIHSSRLPCTRYSSWATSGGVDLTEDYSTRRLLIFLQSSSLTYRTATKQGARRRTWGKQRDAGPPLWQQPTAGRVKPIVSLHRVSVAGVFEKRRAAGQHMAYTVCLSYHIDTIAFQGFLMKWRTCLVFCNLLKQIPPSVTRGQQPRKFEENIVY